MLERPIKTAAVGFGCSSLTGTSRTIANRVLEAAFDARIRHFDVARYYGYGDAKGILGKFLKGRRTEVTITTKFGIEPPRRSTAFRLALGIGRKVLRLVPAAHGLLQRGTKSLVKSGDFSVRQAQASLETSLRELGTDHIDFYLLHDYAVTDQRPDELLAFLEDCKKAGKIGAFGIGTSFEDVLGTIEQQPRLCGVVQFKNSVLTRNIERLPRSDSRRLVITHGGLGENHRLISKFLEMRRDVAQDWAARIGCDRLDEDTLASLLLNYAASANPEGFVLFSSRNPARVSRNAKAVTQSRFSAAQIDSFVELAKRESAAIMAAGVRTELASY